MAIVFPASPSVNETFTAGSITYKWDGDKWIGLGVTPADRLVEGSNSLEIDANNNLVWSGGNLLVGKPAGNFVLDVEKSDENTLRLSNSAETTHGSHDTKLVSGRSFYSNFLLEASSYKFQTWDGSAIANRLVVDSNGNVGINKTPETDWNTAYRALEIGNSSVSAYQGGTYPSIELNMNCRGTSASYGAGWKYISAGERASQIQMPYSGEIEFKHASVAANAGDTISWQRSAIFTNTGNLAFPSGQGIDFSANGNAAGMTSELLDDYEEGTFTPNLDVSGTSGTLSIGYTRQSGRYIKVGRLVHFSLEIRLSSWSRGTATGGILIQGLPFAPIDTNNYDRSTGYANLYNWSYSATASDNPMWSVYQDAGQAWINLVVNRVGNTTGDVSDPSNNSMLFISGTYEAGS